jgi:hypothetical protein
VKPALVALATAFLALGSAVAPARASSLSLPAQVTWPSAGLWAPAVTPLTPAARRTYGPPQRSKTGREARPRRREPEPRGVRPPQQARPVEAPRWEPGSGY